MTDDLVKRLQGASKGLCTENPEDYVAMGLTVADALQAADRIEELEATIHQQQAEIERLRDRSQFLWTSEQQLSDNKLAKEAAEEIERLRKAFDIYERERERFMHNAPEITGVYFLAGGHGEKDANQLPQYVRICPAYGCAWEQVYEKTERTVTYEGS